MSQQWEPPGQQPHPEEQQPTTDLPGAPEGGTTAYLPPSPDPYPAPAYQPQPYAQGYQPYATHPPVPVSGTTTMAAGVIQIVHSAIWLVVGLVLMAMSGSAARSVDDSELPEGLTRDDLQGVIMGAGVVTVMLAGAMVTLAILTLRRINGCRIASAVMETVFGAMAMLGLLGVASGGASAGSILLRLLHLGGCAAAAVLLFHGSTARYCKAGYPGGAPGARPY
jgi:hypothetical protein